VSRSEGGGGSERQAQVSADRREGQESEADARTRERAEREQDATAREGGGSQQQASPRVRAQAEQEAALVEEEDGITRLCISGADRSLI
jgi:hypothetical protein